MRKPMRKLVMTGALLLVTLAAGWWLGRAMAPPHEPDAPKSAEREPLYWVAPMDPSYRSDRPGKSPMGMDLVPVYGEDQAEESPGTVRVTPDVQHNLGVRIAPAIRDVLEVPIRSVGFIQFDEGRLTHIHTRVEGWIQSLSVNDAGEPVREGQVLFTLYSPMLVKAQEEYLLSGSDIGASLRGASRDRLQALGISSGAISRIEREGRADQSVPVVADRDGVVGRLNVREGMFVRPDLEVMSIGALDQVWVTVELFERESVFVEEGQEVRLRLEYLPGREWDANVDYVYPVLDAATRTVRVRMVLDNSDGLLKPGMFGDVTILTRSRGEVLSVPREAVIRGIPVDRVVLALGNGRFRSQPVVAGREAGGRVEILDGLRDGDRVVVSGQFLIDSESSREADLQRMDGSAPGRDQSQSHNGGGRAAQDAEHQGMAHGSHQGHGS